MKCCIKLKSKSHQSLSALQTKLNFLFLPSIYPSYSQEHMVGNYPDLLPEIPRYCCPLVFFKRDISVI